MSTQRSNHLRAVPKSGILPPEVVDPPAVNGQPPPHDLDAEAAVLSACLLEDSVIGRVLEILKPEHFYSEANARIFQAIGKLFEAGIPVDIVSVASWLRDREWLHKLGGTAYLAQLADATPAVGNVYSHAKTVSLKARRRRAIAKARFIVAEGHTDVGDEDAWLEKLGADITEAAADDLNGSKGAVYIGEAVAETFKQVENYRPGEITGYSTGLPSLDAVTGGMHGGEVLLLKAKKKTGKSVLSGQLAGFVADQLHRGKKRVRCTECGASEGPCERHRWQRRGAYILALEGKRSDWSSRLVCAHARVDAEALRHGRMSAEDWKRFTTSADHVSKLPIKIDDRKDLCSKNLAIRVRAARDEMAESGVILSHVVLDNIQLWRGEPNDRRDRKFVLDEAMRDLCNLATLDEMQEITWTVVSQVNADGVARDSGAALEAHADTIAVLSVDEDEEPDGAHAARLKVEFQRRGPPGIAPLWFYPKWTLFTNGA